MHSYWEEESFLHSDVLIVGGGILGISAACSLKERNRDLAVTVLERGIIPTGASTRNAGFACFGSVTELLADEKALGPERMIQLVNMRWQGLSLLDQRLGEQAMDYQHFGGYELITHRELPVLEEIDRLNKMLLPIFEMEVFHRTPSKIAEFGLNGDIVEDLIFNPFEGQVDTGKMMRSYLKYAQGLGIMILTGAEVLAVENDQSGPFARVNNPMLNSTTEFRAQTIAVCTNAFLSTLFPQTNIIPGRGQVILTKPIEGLKLEGVFHYDEGFYYFRNFGNRVLFGGGRHLDPEKEQSLEFSPNKKIIDDLTDKLMSLVVPEHQVEIDYSWQGIMGFNKIKFPFITEMRPNVFAAHGCNGMGLAMSGYIGEDLADQILKK